MKRPLSPHLGIYKPQLTSILSILHRGAGVGLFLGVFFLISCIAFIAMGSHAYEGLVSLLNTVPGFFVMGGWIFALYYHLLNGVRHLMWDSGRGYSIPVVYATGWIVVVLSIVLTLGTCWYFFFNEVL